MEKNLIETSRLKSTLEKHILSLNTDQAAMILGSVSAVSSYLAKSVDMAPITFDGALEEILAMSNLSEFKDSKTLFGFQDKLFKQAGFDLSKRALDYFYFDFMKLPDSVKKELVNFNPENPSEILSNPERNIRLFGLNTSLNFITDFLKNPSLNQEQSIKLREIYQKTRYTIDCMTYFSSTKLDQSIVSYLVDYKRRNQNGRFFFFGVGCAWADDEAKLVELEHKMGNKIFDKIYATDISENFLSVASKRNINTGINFEKASIYDLDLNFLKNKGLIKQDKTCIMVSGVLSRIDKPFFQLRKLAELSDVIILSEGFPFHSDVAHQDRTKLYNIGEILEVFSKEPQIQKPISYTFPIKKSFEWEVMTLRDGYEKFDNELVVIEVKH